MSEKIDVAGRIAEIVCILLSAYIVKDDGERAIWLILIAILLELQWCK